VNERALYALPAGSFHHSFHCVNLSSERVCADVSPLKTWIKAQGEIVSLRGNFSQERKIKVLRKTLVAPGRFWYQAPDQFRWEIGEPTRSIAIHSREKFTMINLEKGKAEVQDIGDGDDTSRLVAYFHLSFPRDWESFQREFRILSVAESGGVLQAELEPLQPGSARGVRTITFRNRSQIVCDPGLCPLSEGRIGNAHQLFGRSARRLIPRIDV